MRSAYRSRATFASAIIRPRARPARCPSRSDGRGGGRRAPTAGRADVRRAERHGLRDGPRLAAGLADEAVESLDDPPLLVEVVGREEVPHVGMARGEGLDDLRAHAADQERRVWALHALRLERPSFSW
jgi:hypothetical protein